MRKGPKGIVPPKKRNFLHITSMIATVAPVKKAAYRLTIMRGKPKKKPIEKASFTSPKPIPFPFVKRFRRRKNKKAPSPESR